MTDERKILHVDMDAFYASIEQRDFPELRDQPVVVGGGGNRGVVAAASYESRRYGIRSAMPMREARRRCATLVQVPPRMSHYQRVSRQVFAIFREFTPLVEGLSLDEAFLDVGESLNLFGDEVHIARSIKQRILEDTGLTSSVGVAPNKLVAKIASDLDKPDGLVAVAPGEVSKILDPLPVAAIPGVGRQTLARLKQHGINDIRDLRLAPQNVLTAVFGRFAERMRSRAQGIDSRPVVAERDEKSISTEETFDVDITDKGTLNAKLLGLTERTSARLRAKSLVAKTVQVKIRSADFSTFTRQMRLSTPSNNTDQIYAVASQVLARWLSGRPETAIRLLGVGSSGLAPAVQGDLFGDTQENTRAEIDRTVDGIRGRFGTAAVSRARSMKPE